MLCQIHDTALKVGPPVSFKRSLLPSQPLRVCAALIGPRDKNSASILPPSLSDSHPPLGELPINDVRKVFEYFDPLCLLPRSESGKFPSPSLLFEYPLPSSSVDVKYGSPLTPSVTPFHFRAWVRSLVRSSDGGFIELRPNPCREGEL